MEIVPELKKWSFDGSLPLPDCLYADDNVIVLEHLEDYKPLEYSRGGLTLEECTKVLEVRNINNNFIFRFIFSCEVLPWEVCILGKTPKYTLLTLPIMSFIIWYDTGNIFVNTYCFLDYTLYTNLSTKT